MKLIIHDLDKNLNSNILKWLNLNNKQTKIICENDKIHHCIGCFGCWIKTPGQCVLKDSFNNMGELMAGSNELIIISKCKYGTYSPFVRNILDRCLPYIHPDFTKRNGEIHHKARYKNKLLTNVYFYGAKTIEETETAKAIVRANTINFNGIVSSIEFFDKWEDIFNDNRIN